MTITTFKKAYVEDDYDDDNYTYENLIEIKNVEQLSIIKSKETNKILIDYRLKNKRYSLYEWEEHDIPIDYELIITNERNDI